MTVMFIDIVGSTPLAETLDPEEFREILAGYQQACARRSSASTAISRGTPATAWSSTSATRRPTRTTPSARCTPGWRCSRSSTRSTSRLRELHGISLRVRIGVHTGIVVAGEMGVGGTRERMAIVGETPHIAARLESIAAPADGGDQRRHPGSGRWIFRDRAAGRASTQGGVPPDRVHRVVRATGAVGRLEVVGERRLTPVVGRDPELARLAQAWQQVERGDGGHRPHHRRGRDRQEPARPRADGPAQPAGRPGADLAVLAASPRHHAVPGHPLPRAPAGVDALAPPARAAARGRRGRRVRRSRPPEAVADPGRSAGDPGRARRRRSRA